MNMLFFLNILNEAPISPNKTPIAPTGQLDGREKYSTIVRCYAQLDLNYALAHKAVITGCQSDG